MQRAGRKIYLQTAVLVEVVLLFLAAPGLLFPTPELAAVSFALLAAQWLLRRRRLGRFTVPTDADWPIVLLLLALCISVVPSFDWRYSLPKFTGIWLGVATYYTVANLDRSNDGECWLRRVLLAAAAGTAVLALLATGWYGVKLFDLRAVTDGIPSAAEVMPRSVLGPARPGINPNQAGGTLALLLPVPVALALADGIAVRRAERALYALVSALMSLTLLLTQSRSAWFGALVAALALALGSGGVRQLIPAPLRRLGRARLALAGIAACAPLLAIALLERADAATGATGNGLGRLELWRRTLPIIADYPLTGVGLNTYPFVMDALYDSPELRVPHAHNLYLHTAVDLGLPGLAALLLLGVAASAMARRTFGEPGAPLGRRALARGCLHGLMALGLYGLTDAVTLGAKPGVFAWGLLGTLALLTPPAAPRHGVRRRERIVAAAGAVALVALAVLQLGSVTWTPDAAAPISRDWSSLAVYLEREADPPDLILVHADGAAAVEVRAAYAGDADVMPLPPVERIREVVRGRHYVWLVESLEATATMGGLAPRAQLEQVGRVALTRRFPEARVSARRYELPADSN